jgi:hypothetical protein
MPGLRLAATHHFCYPFVGAGHAREQNTYRGHGPLLRVSGTSEYIEENIDCTFVDQ